MKRKLKPIIVCLLIPLAIGGLGAGLTNGNFEFYKHMERPPLAPPAIAFPIVWAALYILMGVGSYLVWSTGDERRGNALTVYGVSLLLNFAWPLLFFGARKYWLAFAVLAALFVAVIGYSVKFGRLNRAAGLLQIPHNIWLVLAGYLNLWVAITYGS